MIISMSVLAVTALVETAKKWETEDNNKQAEQLSVKAAERYYKAVQDDKESTKKMEKALLRLATRKRAIIKVSLKKFTDVFSKIAQISMNSNTKGFCEVLSVDRISKCSNEMQGLLNIKIDELTDSQLLSTCLFSGISGIKVKESELNLYSAQAQSKQAKIYQEIVDTKISANEMLITHIDNITNVITKLNFLFSRVLKKAEETINRNGFDGNNYSDEDLVCIGTCMELAHAVKEYIDIPIIDPQNGITQAALGIITSGKGLLETYNRRIEEMK